MGKIPRLGDYLTSADVKDGDIVEIIEEPTMRSAEETGFDRDVWGIQVKLPNKSNKLWTLNKTTYNACWDAFGEESKNWVGQKLKITTETRKVRGEKKTIIYGEPITQEKTQQISLENLTPQQIQQLAQQLQQSSQEAATETS
jgi:hypothetical protein